MIAAVVDQIKFMKVPDDWIGDDARRATYLGGFRDAQAEAVRLVLAALEKVPK